METGESRDRNLTYFLNVMYCPAHMFLEENEFPTILNMRQHASNLRLNEPNMIKTSNL